MKSCSSLAHPWRLGCPSPGHSKHLGRHLHQKSLLASSFQLPHSNWDELCQKKHLPAAASSVSLIRSTFTMGTWGNHFGIKNLCPPTPSTLNVKRSFQFPPLASNSTASAAESTGAYAKRAGLNHFGLVEWTPLSLQLTVSLLAGLTWEARTNALQFSIQNTNTNTNLPALSSCLDAGGAGVFSGPLLLLLLWQLLLLLLLLLLFFFLHELGFQSPICPIFGPCRWALWNLDILILISK